MQLRNGKRCAFV